MGITCTHQTTPGTVAFRRVQRHAILSDPAYKDGDYAPGTVLNGMKIARELGLTCYRSREELDQTFDWNPTGSTSFNAATFDVENYMTYEVRCLAALHSFGVEPTNLTCSTHVHRNCLLCRRPSLRAPLTPTATCCCRRRWT